MRPQDFLGFLPWDEFKHVNEDAELWLLHPILPVGGYMNIYGEPKKARKSYLTIGMAHVISNPAVNVWLDRFQVRSHGPVVMLQSDTPHGIWMQRIKDIESCGRYDFSNVFCGSGMTLPYPTNVIEHEEIIATKMQEVEQRAGCKPAAIFLDTLATLHTNNENDTQQMNEVMNAISRIAIGAARILVSHSHKKGGDIPTDDDDDSAVGLMKGNRGSSTIAGGVDTIVRMTPKGIMQYQGRTVGEKHMRLKWAHVHDEGQCPYEKSDDCMGWEWMPDETTDEEVAKGLVERFPKGSERSIAKQLSVKRGIKFETARSIVRRMKPKS